MTSPRGEASGDVKRVLKELGFDPDVVRNVSIAMYEGEINMVIHAGGGEIDGGDFTGLHPDGACRSRPRY